tara:strand:+ start:397 stop:717 length:321 start_codon:yes stop_codon:yes gene_type:complete
MKRYLYFGEATVVTTGEACMFSVDRFLGMTPASAATVTMHFMARNGALADDVVTVTHTGHTTKAFMTEMVKFMQANQKNPFLVVADKTNPTAVTNMIASVAVATVA